MTKQSSSWRLEHSYQEQLSSVFYALQPLQPLRGVLCLLNLPLAEDLGLDLEDLQADYFLGSALPWGGRGLSQAYAGHQFGHFTMLGDGRAMLLGEQRSPQGHLYDVQLKGSGPSRFARRGDGRATLSAMLREYLMSEAMHHLGIPSTRSLALCQTEQTLYRQHGPEAGGILTRIAASHIRIGTFEYAAYLVEDSTKALQELLNYTLARHYPSLLSEPNPALSFLAAVQERQINLLVHWLRVGFVHGVMNTDNISICGETIDYGPCAFIDHYDPKAVFSSIDSDGRYAFGNQIPILHWNLARLGQALLPLIAQDEEEALALAKGVLEQFPKDYHKLWLNMMRQKLGLNDERAEDLDLVRQLLALMYEHQLDYTNTFLYLQSDLNASAGAWDFDGFKVWLGRYRERCSGLDEAGRLALMRGVNPQIIPRNYWIEQVLSLARMGSWQEACEALLRELRRPYERNLAKETYQTVPKMEAYQTFCGT